MREEKRDSGQFTEDDDDDDDYDVHYDIGSGGGGGGGDGDHSTTSATTNNTAATHEKKRVTINHPCTIYRISPLFRKPQNRNRLQIVVS